MVVAGELQSLRPHGMVKAQSSRYTDIPTMGLHSAEAEVRRERVIKAGKAERCIL